MTSAVRPKYGLLDAAWCLSTLLISEASEGDLVPDSDVAVDVRLVRAVVDDLDFRVPVVPRPLLYGSERGSRESVAIAGPGLLLVHLHDSLAVDLVLQDLPDLLYEVLCCIVAPAPRVEETLLFELPAAVRVLFGKPPAVKCESTTMNAKLCE